ncbi:DUF4446 family protein [Ornithinicoccus halotolerans]|uniref:DUF4446 family protein n=1 Tax=Ornithinicoccus halotolerans TaxID=1748220 RepID=UPI001E2BB932|nr:DUF4446 family protein [Ornithinicoccus halotolerans]
MSAADPLAWTAGLALLVAVLAVLLALALHRRQHRLSERLRTVFAEAEGEELTTVLARQARRVEATEARVEGLEGRIEGLRGDLRQVLQHVAVVRYDAFGDMGGRMSFSVALVDDHGDGMVLSSIHARGESRTYAKGVVGGRSDQTLSPEEQQALAAARGEDASGPGRVERPRADAG